MYTVVMVYNGVRWFRQDRQEAGVVKQKLKCGDEFDVVTRWRYVLCRFQRAGEASRVKKRLRRRARREARQQIREGREL